MGLGENIKQLRKNKGLTQKKLGELIGVKAITIRKYESNEREPNLITLNKIADALGVTINDLLNDTEPNFGVELTKSTNKNYYSNLSLEELRDLIKTKSDNKILDIDKIKNLSYEEMEEFFNSLSEINPMKFKLQHYIDNFDDFTIEDLIDISNDFAHYATELVNTFIKKYHNPAIQELTDKLIFAHKTIEEGQEIIREQEKIIKYYDNKFNELKSVLSPANEQSKNIKLNEEDKK